MNAIHKETFRLNLKLLALLSVLVLIGGYLLFGAWFRVSRHAQTREAERGAEHAMAEANRVAAGIPLPAGWKKKTRQVTLVLPLGNRQEEVTYWVNSVGMRFLPLPAGQFVMGQDNAPKFPDAAPEHFVRITRPFFMGACEVTRGQYESITGKYVPGGRQGSQLGDEPAYRITWDNAQMFCRILSQREGSAYRLPTEAEWEYACRAGTTTGSYIRSGDPKELSCICYKPEATVGREKHTPRYHPEPVGTFPPNPFGLFDMAGNVSEWCQDWYAKDYYASSPTDDPQGPLSGTMHVRRGGSYETGRLGCRSYYRVSPEGTGGAGFRIVLPIDAVGHAVK